jgi:thiamine monophosphate synthase
VIPPLLAITPPQGPVPRTVVDAAVDLGVSIAVLLREEDGDPRAAMGERTHALRTAALSAGFPVLLSCPSEDMAAAQGPARDAGLAGVQLKGDPTDEALLRARTAWPEGTLGASVHGEARPVPADYLVFAPVFTPRTRAKVRKRAAGVDALRRWASTATVFALGGIEPANAEACVAAGAYGLAGISSFLGTRDAVTDTLRAFARALTLRTHVPSQSRG